MPNMATDLMTVHETAKYLRVSILTVRRLIWAGKLPYVDISTGSKRKSYRIRRKELREYLDKNGGVN